MKRSNFVNKLIFIGKNVVFFLDIFLGAGKNVFMFKFIIYRFIYIICFIDAHFILINFRFSHVQNYIYIYTKYKINLEYV